MEALQNELNLANQQRDAAQALATQAAFDQAAAQAQTALAVQNLAAANAAAATASAITFALSPALASNALLNYKTGEGIKIYGKATSPLDILYDGDSGALRLFLFKVQQRSTKFGWSSILRIQQTGQSFNFFESYGQVTITSIRAQAMTIETANSRDTQNSSQMYDFLIASITDGMLAKVMSRRETFTSAAGFQDGPSLLKVIVTIAHVDTRAQAGYIRKCLARLHLTILTPEYNCDIQKFNEHIVVLEEGLAARGESSQDILMNVQDAYMACKDADFVRHAKDEYSKWEQGAPITLQDYMDSALTKYKTLKMKGLWEAPSPEQEQIIALTAAFSSLKAKTSRTKDPKDKGPGKKKPGDGKDKGPRRNKGAFAWKDVAPKSGEKTKTFKGKTYYWCTNHEHSQWTLHNPDSFPNLCKGHPNYAAMEAKWKASGGGEAAESSEAVSAADIKLESALAAIDEESDSDQEGDY
jgi:YHS domain-containing protein